jgi:transposase
LLRDVLPGTDRLDRANNSGVTPPQRPNGKQVIARSVALEATIAPDTRDVQATIAVQAALIAELRAQVSELAAAKATLQARVAELERQLGRDSSNSSKPPSSDGLGKPTTPARERRAGGRKPGKQPGAPGAHLARIDDPDEVVVHAPERCDGCGADLTLAPVIGVQARQVFDLPEIRLRSTEHRAERRLCGCGRVTTAAFPGQARAVACYGPGVRALACYLVVGQYLPVERATQLLASVLGAPVAAGTLTAIVAEGAGGLGGFAEQVRTQLAAAQVAHFDESGARVAGRLHWVHSASDARLSWFTVHPKRGADAMQAAEVLPGFQGVAVHDGWAPYWRYETATHALCNAHHLRELEAAAAEPRQGWAAEMAEWLSVAHATAARVRDAGASRVEARVLAGLLGRYEQIIAKGHAANPPPPRPPGHRGRVKQSPAVNLLERLDARRDAVCRFLVDLRVPFSNNQAERDIRMVKLAQKISGCWRTLPGAQAFCTLRSYISTGRKQGMNPLVILRRLFEGDPWLPAPART